MTGGKRDRFGSVLQWGLDYPSLYMCKPKRGMKRDESKETYKLPHRLIEKKRRDRINECIAQLKDLLPEHLKLTTLGHLEKAVVLELTLKHLKALTALTEQQHQKIIALQNGERSPKSPSASAAASLPPSELAAFHSGFQSCAQEVLRFLSRGGSQERLPRELLGHLHSLCAGFLPGSSLPPDPVRSKAQQGQPRCVPVIQRTQAPQPPQQQQQQQQQQQSLSETDTDTDSGYGGEGEARLEGEKKAIKQEEEEEEEEEVAAKRRKGADCFWRPDPALLGSWVALGAAPGSGPGSGSGPPLGQQQHPPLCLPFYFIAPSSYLQPFLDKSPLEKYLYPAAAAAAASPPFPLLYPGLPAQAAAVAAAAAAAFPRLSSSSSSSSSVLLSPDGAAPPPLLKAAMEADLPPQEEESPPETLARQQGIRDKSH
ncbi:class E basic helix-loop-helix protein 41 isoform X2 [Sceloporus undulatus]|uniref:class E basic helix-loop-helix protein 41 isoform X2 n=1 Tax=Sceloporus undulatus TaxID=8520 RepID=UPI001C4D3759|nr:class E basic helix-loop-helix protein 41 isoform X2 [Sceloporus undulatus]